MTIALRDQRPHPLAGAAPFVSAASYWQPDLMLTSAWTEHAPFACWLVEAMRPRSIVELGVHNGFSYFVLCQAARALALETRCFGIDRWTGDDQTGFYDDEVYDAVSRHNRRYEDFSRLIRMDFSDARDLFAEGSIDLLHIDGFHSYEAVRRDFETWLPKLSDRGVILFHDTAEFGAGFGVHRLWAELSDELYPHFAFTHGHGLGVLGVGAKLPGRVSALFKTSADSATADAIRMVYHRLGAAQHARALQRRVTELERAVAHYQASASWRVTAPLRALRRLARPAIGLADDVGAKLRDATTLSEDVVPPAYRPQYRSPAR
jgi:predicted O-methyltransferase YrrM